MAAFKNVGRNLKEDLRRNYQLYIIFLPALAYFIIFHYLPMYGVQIAFRNYLPARGIWGSEWWGMYHFERFFRSYNSTTVILNTLKISLLSLVLGFPCPVILALLINELRFKRFQKSLQMISYAPHFVSTVAIVGMITIMFSNQGLVSAVARRLGLPYTNLLISPTSFVWIYVLSGIWQGMGWGSVIYFSVLAGIDVSMHEAAYIDGATKMQRILYIDLPSIAPTMVIMLILNCGSIMSVGYEKIYLMQNPLNLSASEIISTYVYKMGLINSDFSYSAAIGLFNSVVNLVLLVLVNTIARKISDNSLW
ncbi:MAG: ABC transporter permease subunit [Eubacteriales bacterium]|nr:ABC transporter permease subunit [Eubacteriales bacterium]